MFDLSKKKKDQYSAPTQLSPIYAPTIRAAGPRISSLPALRSQTPTKFDYSSKLTTSHVPTVNPAPQQNQNLFKSFNAGVSTSQLGGQALNRGISNYDSSRLAYEPKTLGEKIAYGVGNLGADLPLWMLGDAALARPLAALAKTAPIAKVISKLPSALKGPLRTGVVAGSTYGAAIAPLETLTAGDGLQGLIQREKQLPLMIAGGAALHGAGSLLGKGAKPIIDYKRFNTATKLPEIKENPIQDIQTAYKAPTTLRDVRQQSYNKTFADVPVSEPIPLTTERIPVPRQGMSPAANIKAKRIRCTKRIWKTKRHQEV